MCIFLFSHSHHWYEVGVSEVLGDVPDVPGIFFMLESSKFWRYVTLACIVAVIDREPVADDIGYGAYFSYLGFAANLTSAALC